MRRSLFVGVLVVTASLVPHGGRAGAQTQADVDAARVELAEAEAEVARALELHTTLDSALATAIAEADAVQDRMRAVAADIVDLELEIREREKSNASGRAHARDRLMLAYELAMEADGGAALYTGSTILDGLITSVIITRSADDLTYDPTQLSVDREWVEARRVVLDASQAEFRRLSAVAESQAATLGALAVDAQQQLALARVTRSGAEEAHDEAVAEYEALKSSASPAVVRWLPLLEKYFAPNQLPEALWVMTCESRGNPDAVNEASQATGLFQFLPSTWAYSSVAAGFGGYSANHPEANVASAAWLLEHSILIEHRLGPWGPWECNPRLR